jgi:hypothetical protein
MAWAWGWARRPTKVLEPPAAPGAGDWTVAASGDGATATVTVTAPAASTFPILRWEYQVGSGAWRRLLPLGGGAWRTDPAQPLPTGVASIAVRAVSRAGPGTASAAKDVTIAARPPAAFATGFAAGFLRP